MQHIKDLINFMKTDKKHTFEEPGGYRVYEDAVVVVRIDDVVYANQTLVVETKGAFSNTQVLVTSKSGATAENQGLLVYEPGVWEEHIKEKLYEFKGNVTPANITDLRKQAIVNALKSANSPQIEEVRVEEPKTSEPQEMTTEEKEAITRLMNC